MNAFIDVNGVLTSYGYMESNGDDQLVEVPDDFSYAPGSVRYTGSEWVPVIPVVVPPTREEVEASRRRAYADHDTGSDRFFIEAVRILAMGGTKADADAASNSGAARALEIQTAYPWP